MAGLTTFPLTETRGAPPFGSLSFVHVPERKVFNFFWNLGACFENVVQKGHGSFPFVRDPELMFMTFLSVLKIVAFEYKIHIWGILFCPGQSIKNPKNTQKIKRYFGLFRQMGQRRLAICIQRNRNSRGLELSRRQEHCPL